MKTFLFALALSLISALAFADDIVKVYDKEYNLTGYVKDGKVYDKQWNLKYRIEGDKIYDKEYNSVGRVERGRCRHDR